MCLRVLQWNARSLLANGQEFKQFIEEQDVKPNIICVQETWLKPSLDFVLYGYVAVRKDRDMVGGGVATFVQQGINYRILEMNEDVEVVLVDIWIDKTRLRIINFYNPCKVIVRKALESLCEVGHGNILFCGDFNAHNTLWGGTKTDVNGITVEEVMDDFNLSCLNDGSSTRYDAAHGTESAIDLTFTSGPIAGVSRWEVSDHSLGSDHYVITTTIRDQNICLEENWFPRWKLKQADWGLYRVTVSAKLMQLPPVLTDDVDELNSIITRILCDSAEEVIGRSSGRQGRKMVPWWSDECTNAIRIRNKAFKVLKASHTYHNLLEYKRAQARVKRIIKDTKRSYWRAFCSQIGADIKVSDVWGMIRKMGGIRRDHSLPVIKDNGSEAVTNLEKAEMLARAFVRIHSSGNLSGEELSRRGKIIQDNKEILEREHVGDGVVDREFTMSECIRALAGVRNTSPGKDGVCYKMIKELDVMAKFVILKLYNEVWKQGKLPVSWKHSVVVPIGKPGKDKSNVKSYRPIALTSNLCKLMERMVTKRLTYEVEKRGLFSCYQSGFRSGRTTMDSVLCLENEVRKAQVNKESVLAIFFDIEKAYDMLWKEGLLLKLHRMGIKGKMFNWVRDFLRNRTIEVRVGTSLSRRYQIENGTPQGSVCSPVLFNIMINDIFCGIEDAAVHRALYADDGALWMRGRNVDHVKKKMQGAINIVERWAGEWGFRLSVEKTQVICFSKKRVNPTVDLRLYGQTLFQTCTIRYLGIWFDVKLTFREHIQKVMEKCKKAVNVLKCVSGFDWGATGFALRRIYIALVRSVLDYGCVAFMGASKTLLSGLDKVHSTSLRICSGAFRTSSIPALQIETGEMPLHLRRLKLSMAYWTTLRGHEESHPTKQVLLDCWEYGKSQNNSFGWGGNKWANELEIGAVSCCDTVPLSRTPPWLFGIPSVIFEAKNKIANNGIYWDVDQYLQHAFYGHTIIYTDASKDLDGRTGAAVHIPDLNISIKKRTSDHLSILAVEMSAIILALQWIEDFKTLQPVICSDSMSSLLSIENGSSPCRQDLLNEINQILFVLTQQGLHVQFVWVPAHRGVEGNEAADRLAKEATTNTEVQLVIPLSRPEVKVLIYTNVSKLWQAEWKEEKRGRHLYKVHRHVTFSKSGYAGRQEEVWFSRLRIGHTGLNSSLFKIQKHLTGLCEHCGGTEDVEHVLLKCTHYSRQREGLKKAVEKSKLTLSLENLLVEPRSKYITDAVLAFLRESQLSKRI